MYKLRVEEGRRVVWLDDSVRSLGIHVQAARGSGKSRLLGRSVCWQDFVRGIPTIIIDPVGATIDNLLDKYTRQTLSIRRDLEPRLRYFDMSGRGHYAATFPLLYHLTLSDSHFDISQRFLEVLYRSDPALVAAPIQGWNAVREIGTYIGTLLSAMRYQITEALDLIDNPKQWSERIAQLSVQTSDTDVEKAAHWYLNIYKPQATKQEFVNLTKVYKAKVTQLIMNPNTYAMFASSVQSLDLYEVVAQKQTVLLDFSTEQSLELRQFKMLWVMKMITDFAQSRGPAGRQQPLSLVIDELAAIYHMGGAMDELFSRDLTELTDVIARNNGLWLTFCHQEAYQFPDKIFKTLMGMGTQIIGGTSDPEAARRLVRYFDKFTSFLDSTVDAEMLMESYKYRESKPFRFRIFIPSREGAQGGSMRRMSIENIDRDIYPDMEKVRKEKLLFRERREKTKQEILKEIEQRLTPTSQPDKMNDGSQQKDDNLPKPPPSEKDNEALGTDTED